MSIEQELIHYDITNTLEKLYRTNNKYKMCEYLNCLERWILSSVIDYGTVYHNTNAKDPINQKLVSELNDKKIPVLINQILSTVKHALCMKSPVVLQNNTLSFVDKVTDRQGWIVNIKIKNVPNVSITIPMSKQMYDVLHSYEQEPLTLMFLRYSTLINKGQQWALPHAQFKHLVEHYGVNHEGFASPLNSGILSLNTDGKFCSLFKDTDEAFGSIGSFFDQTMYTDPIDLVGVEKLNIEEKKEEVKEHFLTKHWVVNPPFIEHVICRTTEKILSELGAAFDLKICVMVVYILPWWTDFGGYIKIQNSKFLKHVQHMEKKKHFYEHMGDKKIVNSKSTLFVLDTYEEKKDYSNIAAPMML
jgi:hypothetical protein